MGGGAEKRRKESLIMNDTKLEKAIFQGRHFSDTLMSFVSRQKLASPSRTKDEAEGRRKNESDDIKSNGDEMDVVLGCEEAPTISNTEPNDTKRKCFFPPALLRRIAGLCVKNQ